MVELFASTCLPAGLVPGLAADDDDDGDDEEEAKSESESMFGELRIYVKVSDEE